MYLRRLAPIAYTCTIFLFATLAHAQQIDIALGASTLLASKNNSSSEAFQPPQLKGGTYPTISGDVLLRKRLGLNVETSWRYKTANYNGFETYRPVLTDVNALFQPQLRKKIGLDLMVGAGIARTGLSIPGNVSCGSGPTVCYTGSNHFMEHLGGGVRYYVWHRIPNIFIRPEIHYYHIQNNYEFNSGNVFRAGATVGYTFRGR
jgi:hypothetical protein